MKINRQSTIYTWFALLFANAGVHDIAPLGSITEAHFDKIFSVNVKGLLFTVQKALPLFQDGGSIILTASVNASIIKYK
jgi:NAD(P)-dependent dehydrogenase (short-subunit alcohol dehydrogenase family)